MRDLCHRTDYDYRVDGYGDLVVTPRPGKTPARAGHWRTTATEKPKMQPRSDIKPTGGRVERSTKIKPKRRRPTAPRTSPHAMSAKTAHAMWARGQDIC